MTPEFVTGFLIEALKTAILLVSPVLVFGLVAGLMMSMFQAATSIQEMTLIFIPKMLAVGLALLIFFPWMLRVITDFTHNLISSIPMVIR